VVGTSAVPRDQERSADLIAKGHDQGLKAVTYAKLTGGGTTARRWRGVTRVGLELLRHAGVDRNAKHLAEWTSPPQPLERLGRRQLEHERPKVSTSASGN